MESASIKCHCSGLNKCVAMVLSSRNGQNVDCQSWSDQFSRCGRALGCAEEHGRECYMGGKVFRWSQPALSATSVGSESV